MQESNVGGSQLRQRYSDQLAGICRMEQQALQLFTHLAIESGNEVVTSLLRAAAAGTVIQLARLDSLVRTSGVADETRVDIGSDRDRAETPTFMFGGSRAENGDVDDALLDSACRSLRNQIAGYESACAVARQLADYAALDVLLQCLDEELATNAALSKLTTRRTRLLRAV